MTSVAIPQPARSDDIRVAVIGFGLAGQVFHAPLVSATPGMRVASIVTSNPERRALAQHQYPDALLLDSAEAVWQRAGEHDLAVVATSNRTHVPLALAAIAAGLGVVVDKPFAATSAEARRVVQRAREGKKFLSVFQNRRWDSELLTLKRLLASGDLGKVLRFESHFDRWRPEPKGGWREKGAAEEAGGLLYDLGSHLIDQALHVFGPVTQVYAELDRRRQGVEADDDFFVALTHASGVRSHLAATVMAAQPRPRMVAFGTKATYVKMPLDIQEDALRSGLRPDKPGWPEDPPENWGKLGVGQEARSVRSEPGDYRQFYVGVAAAMREGKPPPVDPEEAVRVIEIIEAAQRSVKGRALVAV
jgi:predicted dehydrogenase